MVVSLLARPHLFIDPSLTHAFTEHLDGFSREFHPHVQGWQAVRPHDTRPAQVKGAEARALISDLCRVFFDVKGAFYESVFVCLFGLAPRP